jgi:hypothetical protein
MNDNDPKPAPTAADLQAYSDALTALHDALYQAYSQATDEGQNIIFEISYKVSKVITAVNQAGIAADTAQLAALAPNIDAANQQLQNAQKLVNNWINDVGIAKTVVGALDTAVNLGVSIYGKIP